MSPGKSAGAMCLGLLLAITTLSPADSHATERLVRRVTTTDGLAVNRTGSLAQDPAGFLWVGTADGLHRYDGSVALPWARDALRGSIRDIAVVGEEELFVRQDDGSVWHIRGHWIGRLVGPDGSAIASARDLAIDRAGRLWVLTDRALLRRHGDGSYDRPYRGRDLDGQRPRLLYFGPDRMLYVGTESAVLRIDEGGRLLGSSPCDRPVSIAVSAAGELYVLQVDGTLLHWRNGEPTALWVDPHVRGISMTLREDVIWASYDLYLAAFRPSQAAEILDADNGIWGGGPLLVDREGSLWLGNKSGLLQFPEPETRMWTDRDGLPSASVRYLARTGQRLWVTTWQGLGWLDWSRDTSAVQVGNEEARTRAKGRPCVDRQQAVWTVGRRSMSGDSDRAEFLRFAGQSLSRWDAPGHVAMAGCATSPVGDVWLALQHELWLAGGQKPAPLRVGGLPEIIRSVRHERVVLEDRSRHLWVAAGNWVCGADADALRGGARAPWHCESLPGDSVAADLAETGAGAVWLAVHPGAVFARISDQWRQLPASETLAAWPLYALVPSHSNQGGVWILGARTCMRVRDDRPESGQWHVLEQLSGWSGIPAGTARDLIETADGGRWIATDLGVIRVPAGAIPHRLPAPVVRLAEARAGGRKIIGSHIAHLAHQGVAIELRFAALTFRDPLLVRYKFRFANARQWSSPTRTSLFFSADHNIGSHRVEAVASLDGRSWSAEPVAIRYQVPRPWYLRTPFVLLCIAIALAALYIVHRVRIAILLREQRLRTQLTADLHDEVGSSLGSIGLLADVIADDELPHDEVREMADKIATTAEDVGRSLTSIVWSLRPGAGTLETLTSLLRERAGRLFPSPGAVRTSLPEPMPDVPLAPLVLRHIQLIGLEALHNATRHAGAQHIELGLARCGNRWRLWIADDGCGLGGDKSAAAGSGLGRESMLRRASLIGAELRWEPGPSGGTTVVLKLDPKGPRDYR